VQEWEDKMGLIFTSPPYFFLEDYKHGNQSCTIKTTYIDWLENYMLPSIRNYDRYLVPNGHVIINIKDYLDFTLESDTIRYFAEGGFVLRDSLDFNNNTRIVPVKDGNKLIDNNEKMYVFQRINDKPLQKTDLGEW
jgi:DNA modification methylase